MLGTLRKGAHSFFAKMLMALLVASFAVWGIGDISRSTGETPSVATVGEEHISVAEFQAQMQQLERSFGENFSSDLLRNLNLYSIKLSEMINRSLIRQEVARLGISVSDDDLLKQIAKDKDFHNASGAFDKALFQKTLQQSGIREKEYIESVRMEMAVRVLLDTFSNYSLVPTHLADAVYTKQYEQRRVELIEITHTPAPAAEPTDEELQQFYASRKAQYTAPEYRAFGYVRITPADIYDKIKITRQELFDYYTAHATEFVMPEQREVEQLLYAEKKDAEAAYNLLRSGKKLDEVVKQAPPKNGNALKLGLKTKDNLPAGGEQVFSLMDKGDYTSPVESPFGWHIFILTSIQKQGTASFESVKQELREELRNQRANTSLSETIEQFEDELSAGSPLKEAAESIGATYETVDPVDRFGTRSDNSNGLAASTSDDLLRTAFALQQGERSELLQEPDGGYLIVELDSVTEPRERTFEEVRGLVLEDLHKSKQQQALQEHATKIATLLGTHEKDGIERVIANLEGIERRTMLLTRTGPAKQDEKQDEAMLTPALLKDIFSLKGPGRTTAALPYPGGFVIAALTEIVPPPSPTESDEGRKQFKAVRRSLREDYDNEILDQYLRHLRTRYAVSVNEAAVQSLMSKQ